VNNTHKQQNSTKQMQDMKKNGSRNNLETIIRYEISWESKSDRKIRLKSGKKHISLFKLFEISKLTKIKQIKK
jgi:hypothetical protein